ncbi:MAG: hypothetical protein WD341_00935 [Tistlia sp.]|uniref:hypothetical protein n=1 Tax=Tistlia sp. TaxID=3057121 RepID=UPI0034A4E66C
MRAQDFKLGHIYVDARPPRRQWRIVEKRGDVCVLARVDKPSVMRFCEFGTLLDPLRYVKSKG